MSNQVIDDHAIMYHLRYNHYPPITLKMVEPCKQAIDYCNQGLAHQQVICGNTSIPALEIVEDLNLWEWIKDEEN